MQLVKWLASIVSIYLSFRFADAARRGQSTASQLGNVFIIVIIVLWLLLTEVRSAPAP